MNVSFSCRSDWNPYKIAATGDKPCDPTEAVATPIIAMRTIILAALTLVGAGGVAFGASALNRDQEPRTIVVTEGGSKSELAIGAGETVDFCFNGCFVTLPNGDREALTGAETIEISGGVARIR